MPAIEVTNLQKTFQTKRKAAGMRGSLRALFKPEYSSVEAVRKLTFQMEAGELLGFIGPNGAGKSTTIKMLTGILVPTSGEILANGFRPYADRSRYTKSIGVVFGQRTQLWWDIAVIESFRLLRRIYDVPQKDFDARLRFFSELLGLEEFLHTPVRKLSLGQRMRCDIAASLLHSPRLLFLDEPTIGLDVVANDRIREFLKDINRTLRTTILLTTHDLSDIEELCRRIIIIDHGKLLYDGDMEGLRRRLGRYNQVRIHLQDRKDAARMEEVFGRGNGTTCEPLDEMTCRVRYNPERLSSAEIIRRILGEVTVRDLYVEEEPIEEIIKTIYSRGLEPRA